MNSDSTLKKEIALRALQLYNSLSPVSKELEEAIFRMSYLKKLEDGEELLKQGELCTAFYYVGKGALIGERRRDLKKFTTWLCNAGDSCTSVSGMYGNVISDERIYALGETYVMAVDNDVILDWYSKYPEFNIIMRKMFEFYLQASQQRASMLRMGTAREKYTYFKIAYPGYAEAIPLDIIACFLGMKTSTLAFIVKEERKLLIRQSNLNDQYQLLLEYFQTRKPFLQSSLTLQQLAKEMQLTPHTLSEIINKKSGKNFSDFVNSYRIAYVQERLKDVANWKHLKLEALGAEAGFRSRSSFFSVFKKHVGVSPSSYMNAIN